MNDNYYTATTHRRVLSAAAAAPGSKPSGWEPPENDFP